MNGSERRSISKDEAFALVLGAGKCERYTGDHRCLNDVRRRADAYFEDDKVCDRCILHAASEGLPIRWSDPCELVADSLHQATLGDGSDRDRTLRRVARRIERQHEAGYHAFIPERPDGET